MTHHRKTRSVGFLFLRRENDLYIGRSLTTTRAAVNIALAQHAARCACAQPPESSRSGEHLHSGRGGGGVCPAGDALFHRERFLGDVAARAEGVLPWENSVAATAH